MKLYIFLFSLIIQIHCVFTWESYELDLFDLVEELGLNTNFYEFIGVEQTSELNEIKKAYRKLSLLWHPDKSDEPDADVKFRHLVAVYETLKDERRRERYDRILVEGLPKWNQPMYYFRRAKKLRLWEIATILTFIITIGHYFVLWAVYFESYLTMNEKSMDARKRLEKKFKKSSRTKDIDQSIIDEELARTLPALQSPKFYDILPIKFANILVDNQFFIPHFKNLIIKIVKYYRQKSTNEPERTVEDENETVRVIKRSQAVRINDIVPQMAPKRNIPVVASFTPDSPSATINEPMETKNQSEPWSDEEKQLLCKNVVRFPPGTPHRWEKIAEIIGRPVSQVIDMAKQTQKTIGISSNNSFQEYHQPCSSKITIDQNVITEREKFDSVPDWSQTDQHLLECALKTISKELPKTERWEKIATCIPGKTPEQCLARYQYIAQLVKAKKMA